MRKRWRLYYNTHHEYPHVCSIDNGSHASEIVVQGAEFHGVFGSTAYSANQEYPEPKFWIEFEAVLELKDGIAIFQG